MSEYAVVWRDSEHPTVIYLGGLSLDDHRLRLRGRAGRSLVAEAFQRDEIETVSKSDLPERIAGFPSLRLDFHCGRSLLLASVMGVGVTYEPLETLARLG